ncbi:MAG TPA: protein-glutamate O-methyltransferase CheR [Longimicrobium sp.]|nr:protein-glutamate O-methyltransferase CheR [Longimicrobium sp.]
MDPRLTDEEFRMWGEWLHDELGHQWGPEKREMLRARLEPRRAALGVDTYEQLLFHLKFHPEREAERESIVPYLTNNESYFRREQGTLEVVEREILPELQRAAAARGGEVRILSAACSTGEEAYTLGAMVYAASARARITGVDVDPRALERARAGVYREHAFRGTDEDFRRRYFTALDDGTWRVRPEVKRMVEFRRANLVESEWRAALPPQQLVFCRNVLIYFGAEGMRRAAEGLYQLLAPGGYLFLGHAESLRSVPVPFQLERRPGAIFYRRPMDDTR